MTLSELQSEVYLLTNRPDRVDATLSAIRAATLKIHQKDFFHKDIWESGIGFDSAAYLQQLAFKDLIPRWRALKYVRKTDSTGTELGKIFDIITAPDLIQDDYAIDRTDVCYSAGFAVQFKSSTQFQYILLGCYLHPDITATGYSSWIADEFPYAIVYTAAATIFKQTGDTEQFAAFTALSQEQINLVVLSNIQAQGY
jgi:hypothetical protein